MALKSFKKGKKILENNLAEKMNLPYEQFNENYNKDILKESVFDHEDVKQLK